MNSDPPFRSTAIIVDSRGRPVHWERQPGPRVCFVIVRLNNSAGLQRQKEQRAELSRVASVHS